MRATALAFDVYGTLGDPGRMADGLQAHADEAEQLAGAWRRHQLEISWLLSLMERYEDFEAVTAYALDAALAEAGFELAECERRELLRRVETLELYDDVPEALDRLEAAGFELAVLSNGSPRMLTVLLRAAGIRDRFRHVISVDEVGVFKPAPAVYRHAAESLGRPIGEVWLVSGNPFDVAGGKSAGMRVAKIERRPSFHYGFAAPADVTISNLLDLAAELAA